MHHARSAIYYALPLLRHLGAIPGAAGRSEPTTGAAMIAYLFWHCAYPTSTVEQYEEALMRFQQRLGQQQPPGFGGSASFRVAALPWLGNRPGYEGLVPARWLLGARSARRFRCCWPGDECTRRRCRPRRALRLGLGRTRFVGAVDRSLADAAAGHSVEGRRTKDQLEFAGCGRLSG